MSHSPVLLAFVVTLVFSEANLAAQDRVVLFDTAELSVSGSPLPFALREFEITMGGRGWSLVRTVTLPGHRTSTPVLLADGSRLVWLAYLTGSSGLVQSTVLVQYEFATARASIVNVGLFHPAAVVRADPADLRVAIVEPERVTFVDQRLQPYSVTLSGLITFTAAAANGYVVVQRYVSTGTEAVVINAQTAEVVRSIALPGVGFRVTRDAQRLYTGFEVRSLITGQVLARAVDTACCSCCLYELDEPRGLLIHGVRVNDRTRIVARDATTLARVGELEVGVFDHRQWFQLQQTRNEGAILVFSAAFVGGIFDVCRDGLPRIDVFDGRTFELVKQIDLQRRCTTVIALPPR